MRRWVLRIFMTLGILETTAVFLHFTRRFGSRLLRCRFMGKDQTMSSTMGLASICSWLVGGGGGI